MPGPMLHLSIAKKVNPNASIGFYVGNLAPDGVREREKKDKAHFYGIPDREKAMKQFALKADNEYLKGMLVYLFVDWKFSQPNYSKAASTIAVMFSGETLGNKDSWLGDTMKLGPRSSFSRRTSSLTC